MSFYAVLNIFEDELDGNRFYKVGDLYPRAGLVPTVERIKELMGKNKYGKIFIQKYIVGTGVSGTPTPINLERDMAIARNVHDTVDDRILHDMTNMRNWFDGTIASKAEVDRVTAQLAHKADQAFVDSQFSSIVSGAPKGTYTSLSALQDAYPSGTDGIFLVLDTGHWYYWQSTTSEWMDGGIYQAGGGDWLEAMTTENESWVV